MNKTAQLVLSFTDFEERYPDAGLEDFARHLLARSKGVQPLPGDSKGHSILTKLIGVIMRLNSFYANAALKSIGLGGLDEYTYLLTVDVMTEPMKTEVIGRNFHELSSGLLIISRLKTSGLISEKSDPNDKRSRLITLTKKGRAKLAAARVELARVSQLFFGSMEEDDIRLCVTMLSPIEREFIARWPLDKGKTFDEMVKDSKDQPKPRPERRGH